MAIALLKTRQFKSEKYLFSIHYQMVILSIKTKTLILWIPKNFLLEL